MHGILATLALSVPTPGPEPEDVTPGVWGFVATLAVILVAVLLIIDMVRRIRRVTYRAEVRERLAAEAAEDPERDAPAS